MSRIAPCRSKLSRTRRSKSGSGGTLSVLPTGKDASMTCWKMKGRLSDFILRLRKRQLARLSLVTVHTRTQPLSALPLEAIDLGQDNGDVLLLLIEHGAPCGKHLKEFDQLRPLALGCFVQ